MSSPTEPMLLTISEASRRLQLGRTKTYELVRCGVIPSVRLGRAVRIPTAQLTAWLDGQTEASIVGLSPATR